MAYDNDETIRLILQVTGSQTIEEATGKLQKMKATIQEVGKEAYDLADGFGANASKVQAETDKQVAALQEETRARKIVNELLKETAEAKEKASAAAAETAKLGQSYTKIKTEAAALEKEIQKLGDAFKKGDITLGQYQDSGAALVKSLREKQGALNSVNTATRNFGQGILGASYAVQDFTSQLGTRGLAGGLGAIQNNIPQILSGFGAGAGMAGVVSVAAVAVGLLYENWDKVTALWAAKNPAGTAKEIAEQLEAVKDAADKLRNTPTKSKKKTGELVDEAVTERGEMVGLQIENAMSKTEKLESYITDEDKAQWLHLTADPDEILDPAVAKRRAEAREEILGRARKNRNTQAFNLAGQLGKDRGARDWVRDLDKKAPGILGKGFMTEMALAEPEAQVEMRQLIESEERAGKEMETTRNRMKDAIKAKKEKEKTEDAKFDNAIQDIEETLAKVDESDHARKERADEAKRKAAQAKRDAEHQRPGALNAHQQQEESDMFLADVQRGTAGMGFDADFQKQMAEHAQENHRVGADMWDTFEGKLTRAMIQTRADIEAGFQSRANRQQTTTRNYVAP